MRDEQRHLHVRTLARMVPVRSARTEISMPAGIQRLSSGSSALMRSTVSMTLASACLVTIEQDGRLPVEPAGRAPVAHALLDRSRCRASARPRRAGSTTMRPNSVGCSELVVGRDGMRLRRSRRTRRRARRVGAGDRAAHVSIDRPMRRGAGIDLDPDRRLFGAADRDLGDAFHLRDALRDDVSAAS